MTSFLNPKGLLVYFAILPNFMRPDEPVAAQAFALSAVFIGLCAIVYGAVGIVLASVGRCGTPSDRARRVTEAGAGLLLPFAAARMATK